jgi:homoserine dehydrogenase
LMDAPFQPSQVDRTGIRNITSEMVQAALADGYRYKLVCSAHHTDQGISARVYPDKVPSTSPMYNITGTSSIVQFETDVLGLLTIIEDNPGPHTTAYGLLADFINAVTGA